MPRRSAAAGGCSRGSRCCGRSTARKSSRYFSEAFTELNLVANCGPMPWTVVMIANAIPQAIRQYSMAVAPDWSARNFANNRGIQGSCGHSRRDFSLLSAAKLGRAGCQDVHEHPERLIKTWLTKSGQVEPIAGQRASAATWQRLAEGAPRPLYRLPDSCSN